MRRNGLTAKSFILPVIIIGLFCVAAIFDYTRQHTHVRMLGQTVDIVSIQQVLVEPIGNANTQIQHQFTLTDRHAILQACKLLGTAKPYTGNHSDFTTDMDMILLESSSGIMRIPVSQAKDHLMLLFANGHSYVMPKNLLTQLQKIATPTDVTQNA